MSFFIFHNCPPIVPQIRKIDDWGQYFLRYHMTSSSALMRQLEKKGALRMKRRTPSC